MTDPVLPLDVCFDRLEQAETRLRMREVCVRLRALPRCGALQTRDEIKRARRAMRVWKRAAFFPRRAHVLMVGPLRRLRTEDTPIFPFL